MGGTNHIDYKREREREGKEKGGSEGAREGEIKLRNVSARVYVCL